MIWQKLLDPAVQGFIKNHETDDVAKLALKKPLYPDWPYKEILDQIKSRQKARKKIPLWLDISNIVLPVPSVMEQASSAATARYKASLIQGRTFCDLTGGAGVDSCALTEHYESGVCVDTDVAAAALIAHNLPLLSSKPVDVHHAKAEDFVKNMDPVDLVIIDPQRRDDTRKGKYKFEDCAPNVLGLLPVLKEKAAAIMIKTSPMLDIDEGIRQLPGVRAVHVAEWQGECKELIFIVGSQNAQNVPITAVRLDDEGEVLCDLTFTRAEEKEAEAAMGLPQKYLFEPGPAFQKAGAYTLMATRYGVQKLHPNTHLYTSAQPCPDFPGKHFEVLEELPVDSKALHGNQFNLVIRNFSEKVETLKKRLKIKDGGEKFLFACTLKDGRKALLLAQKCR